MTFGSSHKVRLTPGDFGLLPGIWLQHGSHADPDVDMTDSFWICLLPVSAPFLAGLVAVVDDETSWSSFREVLLSSSSLLLLPQRV